jgi:hypothetical protein
MLPRELDVQTFANEGPLRDMYDAILFGPGHNTYSRSRLLIREAVEPRVAAGERIGISREVKSGRVLVEAVPSVATLAAGLVQFGIAAKEVAVGFDGDLSAERAEHKRIKFGMAPVRFWARVQRSSDESCWKWTGPIDDEGFGFVQMRQWGSNRVCLRIGSRTRWPSVRFLPIMWCTRRVARDYVFALTTSGPVKGWWAAVHWNGGLAGKPTARGCIRNADIEAKAVISHG